MARAFMPFAALLLSASLALAGEPEQAKGLLLTARSELRDPSFRGSVVLVTNHAAYGPIGVILNRPTRVPVSRLFPDMEKLAALDDKVYFGGPVARGAISFLYRGDKPETGDAVAVVEGVYWSGSHELLRSLLGRDKPMEGLQVFVGHAGWAPGQLEREIARRDWNVEGASPAAIFGPRPQHPWPERSAPDMEHRS